MTLEEHADRLIERIGVLRHQGDLDLLVFFARHPRSLLATEQLSSLLGYGLKEIATSLDLLVDAGLVTRSQSPRHAARMFVFAEGGSDRGWFPDLVTLACTREGRLAMLSALRRRSSGDAGTQVTDGQQPSVTGARPFLVQRKPKTG